MKTARSSLALVLILVMLFLPSCARPGARGTDPGILTDVIEPLQDGGASADDSRRSPGGSSPIPGFTDAEYAIYLGLAAAEDSIPLDGYGLTQESLRSSYRRVVNFAPELFYVSSSYSFSHTGDDVTAVMPSYLYGRDEIGKMTAFYRESVEEITSGVDPDWSDLEKALYLHDCLASRYEFDRDHENFDAYSLFSTGKGVCQAYTLAYVALLRDVGVGVDIATGAEMDHTWNKVLIDGNWYHVDVTWDDPLGNVPGEADHEYFLLSDQEAERAGKTHYGWETELFDSVCADDSFDGFFWKDVSTPFAPLGGEWYYVSAGEDGASLCKTDLVSRETVAPLEDRWSVLGEENTVWVGFFTGLFPLDGKIVYNTPAEVMAYDPAAGESFSLGAPDTGGSSLYGCFLEDGVIKCVLADKPHSENYAVAPVKN